MGLPSYMPNPDGKLQLFCNNKPGTWHAMGVTLAAAGSYQWFRDALGSHELARQEAEGIDAYRLLDEEAKAVAPGSEGLIYLPLSDRGEVSAE